MLPSFQTCDPNNCHFVHCYSEEFGKHAMTIHFEELAIIEQSHIYGDEASIVLRDSMSCHVNMVSLH